MDEQFDNQAPLDMPEQHAGAFLMNLQLFAETPVDMGRIADMSDPTNPKYIFALPDDVSDDSDDDEESEVDTDQEDDADMDSIYIPRLAVTDQNLPHAAIGEVVVKDLDGDLYTVAVDKDGTVTETQFTIDTDNIADGSITASKLEENTITSRELDMEQIFADSALLNEMLAANIDAAGLFENQDFLDKLSELTVAKTGDTMTGQLKLAAFPIAPEDASSRAYVDDRDLLTLNTANGYVDRVKADMECELENLIKDSSWKCAVNEILSTNSLPSGKPINYRVAWRTANDLGGVPTYSFHNGNDEWVSHILNEGDSFRNLSETDYPIYKVQALSFAKETMGRDGVDGQSAYAAAQMGGYPDTQGNFYEDLAAIHTLAVQMDAL